MHHIVTLLIPAWGHTAPYLHLALRMLKVDPEVVITVVQHQLVVPQMEAELATCSFDTSRLKIVGVGDPAIDFSVKAVELAFEQVVTGFISLLPSFFAPEGTWPVPKTFHLDFLIGTPCMEPLRQSAGPTGVKVVLWFSAGAVSMLAHFVDHDYDKISNEQRDPPGRNEASWEDVGRDPDRWYGPLFVSLQKFAREADAIVVAASPALESEGVLQIRDFYLESGKKIFHVGPQVHEECWTPRGTGNISDERLASFLKTAVETHGPKSVLLISFGSLFFPLTTPHLVHALVETLLELENPFPFVFALSGKMASLPPQLIERVNSSGKGLVCGWVPQRSLLQSGAVGWFLTHGGWNSISESLSQGIPLIVWPVNAEQPLNAALLSSGPHPVAFELFQIRTGKALAPSLRAPTLKITGTEADAVREFNEVFEKARGHSGMKMREAAGTIARELRESREGEDRTLLIPAWGHTAPYLHLASRMLEVDPELVITVVQHQLVVPQMKAELATGSFDTSRLKIVGIGDPAVELSSQTAGSVIEQVVTGFLALLPSFVAPAGDWPAPKAFHLDLFVGSPCMELLRQTAGPGVKVVLWFSAGAVSLLAHFGEHDYEQIATQYFQDEGRRRGRSFDEILGDIRKAGNGTDVISGAIMKHPGFGRLFVSMQKFAREADAIVVAASPALEPEGVIKTRRFYREQGQSIFHVGLQVHEQCWTPSGTGSISDERLASFVTTAVETHGPKSVLYISFGSLFFPLTTPHLVHALVETLLGLENPFPFVFALGGKMASLPPELIEKVHSSGKGLVCGWTPQRSLLQSGAVGWFLTHGGWNSISESLSQGIPLIIWPVNAEQPLNAALLSSGPQPVAFELFQVIRTGTALAPSLRAPTLKITGTEADAVCEFKEVFQKARGSSGDKMREAAEAIARELKDGREGEDRSEVARLAAF
ncbi:hypothetical protein RQP46_005705 [Phenoliferia psychrophenolica]